MLLSRDNLKYLQDLLFRRSGIILPDSKSYLVETRLSALLPRHQLESLTSLTSRLREDEGSSLCVEVIDAFTTNETSFFRDRHPFELLESHLLPSLIRARQAQRRLRLWSAASSTGQEAYSLAILIAERFPELLRWDVEILGTDISSGVLEKARSGRYRQLDVQRGLTDAQVRRFFKKDGSHYQILPTLQKMVRFEPLNLVKGRFPSVKFDVIMLRNVLIYFDETTRDAVLRKMHPCLAPGGGLFLGSTEGSRPIPAQLYSTKQTGRTIWHQLQE